MINDCPNVLIVPDAAEKPEEIIEDYLDMIREFKDDEENLTYILQDFFDDVNYWSVQQMLIDQAKMALGNLEELQRLEHEFIEDDED